jgi:hypothetical protein
VSDSWRPVVAALADDDVRVVYSRLVLGQSLESAMAEVTAKKRERVLRSLTNARLVVRDPQSGVSVAAAPFAGILAADPVQKAAGVDRFMTNGRIDRYPMGAAERHALLLHVAEHAFRPDEELTEAQVNERLRVFTDDHVTARRYLVDFGILERTRSGTSYALSPQRAEPL